jgi:hypothetical protein
MYKRRLLYNEYDLPDEEICKQYKEGISAYRLAKDYGVATDTILRRLRRRDVPIRHQVFQICEILSDHAKDLKDDPERMSSAFILKMSRKVNRRVK